MEGHESRHQRNARFPAERDRIEKVLACVPFLEARQNRIVYRLDGADDEETPRVAQLGEQITVAKQMLDLDRDVEGDRWMRGMQRPHDTSRVSGTVQEIRIAESDVPCAGADLGGDIGQDDLGLNDPELTLVHRHDRTVPA